jgi:hypothetical protein
MRRLGRGPAAWSWPSRHGETQNSQRRFFRGKILRDSGTQLGAIDRLRKPKNAKTGCQPCEMRFEIENPAVTNRHRLEYTIAEQKAAIGDRNMRVFRGE